MGGIKRVWRGGERLSPCESLGLEDAVARQKEQVPPISLPLCWALVTGNVSDCLLKY